MDSYVRRTSVLFYSLNHGFLLQKVSTKATLNSNWASFKGQEHYYIQNERKWGQIYSSIGTKGSGDYWAQKEA